MLGFCLIGMRCLDVWVDWWMDGCVDKMVEDEVCVVSVCLLV